MGIERIIAEELASISVTLIELLSISRIINAEISNKDFSLPFNNMIMDIANSYDVITANLSPFLGLDTETAFINDFDECYQAYKVCYLKEVSRPRAYADTAYETYLLLKTLKQTKTSYPILRRTFARLDEFIDKWITNDAWLAMSIDNLFKRLPHLLNEVSEIKHKDHGDAYVIYKSALTDFEPFLTLIRQQREHLGRHT